MKRLDKQRAKMERRAQRKLEKRAEKDASGETATVDVAPPPDGTDPQGGAA